MAKPPQARANTATVAEQAAECFRLRKAGLSIDRIAGATGLSHGTVCNRIKSAVADLVGPEAEEYRVTQEGRLDDGLRQVYRVFADPDADHDTRLRAVGVLVKVEERRSKLLGLDATEAMEIAQAQAQAQQDAVLVEVTGWLAPFVADGHRYDASDIRRYAVEAFIYLSGDRSGPLPERPEPLEGSWPSRTDGTEYVIVKGVRYVREGTHEPADLPFVEGEVIEAEDDRDGGTGPGVPDDTETAAQLAIEAARARFPDEEWGDDE